MFATVKNENKKKETYRTDGKKKNGREKKDRAVTDEHQSFLYRHMMRIIY
jgi:hypothetical protein